MRRLAFVAVLFMLMPTADCLAAFTNFSDLNPPDNYHDGEVFTSNGINFAVHGSQSSYFVGVRQTPGGTPALNDIFLGFAWADLEIEVPANTGYASFNYFINDAAALSINGNSTPETPASLLDWDGTTVGGVDIDVDILVGEYNEGGVVKLRGPIQSLSIYGLEFSIDNLSLQVPEPSTLTLLLVFITTLVSRRRIRIVYAPN